MRRLGLLLGTSAYSDPALRQLRTPSSDLPRLASVLADPQSGGFDEVRTEIDQPAHLLHEAIEDLLADRSPEDTVLLYLSCHAVIDTRGSLHFAATNSRLNRLASTGLSASYIQGLLSATRAQNRVLLLDCCYSGSAASGLRSISHSSPVASLADKNYVLWTSSPNYEYALEGSSIVMENPQPSLFTRSLVEGIQTGEADQDGDGAISIAEMHTYIMERAGARSSSFAPALYSPQSQQRALLCRSPLRISSRPTIQQVLAESHRETSLHIHIHRENLATPNPRQLPPPVPDFTGRASELARLDAIATEQVNLRSPCTVVTGPPGVGKTALALHWAHLNEGKFPDGQVYVSLRDRPEPQNALDLILRSLGVHPSQLPSELPAKVSLYRSLLAGRRLLVFLDDVVSAEQVRPLLLSHPECHVLVTSRSNLSALAVTSGATRLTLDPLPHAESLDLLRRSIGDRVTDEPEAASEMARLCAYLPLALRIAGVRASTRPHLRLADLVKKLQSATNPLDFFAVDADPASVIRTTLSWSYEQLSAETALVFRALGVHPRSRLSTHVAAAMADVSFQRAEVALEILVDAHLIDSVGRDRFVLHDLVYRYAIERANDDPSAFRECALDRMATWYLHAADAAARLLSPHRHRVLEVPVPSATACIEFRSFDDALNWLEDEEPNLVATVQAASENGQDHLAWQLAVTLWDFFNLRKSWDSWVTVAQTAVTCARRVGDRRGEGLAFNCLGDAYADLRRYGEALDCYQIAIAALQEAGDLWGESWSLNSFGLAYLRLGRHDNALEYFEMALEVQRSLQDSWGEGWTNANLGETYQGLGQHDEAVAAFEKSLAHRLELGDRYGEGLTLHNLGTVNLALGEHGAAVAYFTRSLAGRRDVRDRWGEAATLGELGVARLGLREYEDAAEACRKSLAIYQDLGDSWGAVSSLRKLALCLLYTNGYESAAACWQAATSYRSEISPDLSDALITELPARHARVWLLDGDAAQVGLECRVSIAYGDADAASMPENSDSDGNGTGTRLRIALNVPGANTVPVSRVLQLKGLFS